MDDDMTRHRIGYGGIQDPDTLELIRRYQGGGYLTQNIAWTGDTRLVRHDHPMWVEEESTVEFFYRGWRVDFNYHQSVPRKSGWILSDPAGNHAALRGYSAFTNPVNICVLLRVADWMAHHGWAPGWEDHVVSAG